MLKFASTRDLNRARVALAQYNRMWPPTMKAVPRQQWPPELGVAPATALNAWRSCDFLAVLYSEPGKTVPRLSVCRTRLTDTGDYEANISWDDLMAVKDQCGFGDQDAVELYPRTRDVVNVANMRHLWILPTLSDLAWREKDTP